ncbi:MAG TPA: tetratricopeptide repeat protein [Gemmataceae bacterium]|nr:tetratricopeptide repeat protein [Gemmataceae bacterium]
MTSSDGSPGKVDDSHQQTPHAQTCVAFADYQARSATDPHRTPLDKEQLQDRARRSYEQALKIDAGYLPAYVGLARLYQAMGDTERALETYRKGLERVPGSPVLSYEQGTCLARLHKWSAAVTSLQAAVAHDAENRGYIKTLAFCLGRAGRFDESLACFRQVTGEAQAHYDLARLLHHMGENEHCRKELKLALAVQPDLASATQLLAELDKPSQPTAQAAPPATVHLDETRAAMSKDDQGDSVARIGR